MASSRAGKMGGDIMPNKSIATVLSQVKKSNGAILAICVGTAVAAISSHQSTQAEKKQNDGHQYLETYLMDKIAKKPYLNYHSASSSAYQHQAKRYHRGRQSEEPSTNTDDIPKTTTRPKGVPSRLRLLTINVPQFKREAFEHGVCKLPSEIFDTDKPSFVDGVAPSKTMNKSLGHNKRTAVVQKSLAKQLYYCYDPPYKNSATTHNSQPKSQSPSEEQNQPSSEEQKPNIGVEILEASIMDLNPNNIRRTYTYSSNNWKKKSYRYDPGKYTEKGENSDEVENDEESGVADVDEADVEEASLNNKTVVAEDRVMEADDDVSEESDIDNADYEIYAPWNQYAWLEELHLRINGIVPFGTPMQRAHVLSQWIYGRIYRQSIPASTSRGGWVSWLWWPVLWSGSHAIGSQRHRTSWDGVDGEGETALYGSNGVGSGGNNINAFFPWLSSTKATLNRASNKPDCVIRAYRSGLIILAFSFSLLCLPNNTHRHAVICDGAVMRRVPGSLRYLTKICREAGIPLFILNDHRSWGSQTHSTLSDALVDMRKAISDNV
ncbi:hypothetical protein ACHAXR_002162, partial [Thalassiosira sp. AJA248-18]